MLETDLKKLKPKIQVRNPNPKIEEAGLNAGLHPILARIIAGRPIDHNQDILQTLSPKLNQLSQPHPMADMEKAATRILLAIQNGECIGIETDHDCDGQTAHAVLYYNLHHRFGHP